MPDGTLAKSVGFILQICLAKTTPPKKKHLEKGDLGLAVKLIFYYHRSQVATAQSFLLVQGLT